MAQTHDINGVSLNSGGNGAVQLTVNPVTSDRQLVRHGFWNGSTALIPYLLVN